MLQSVLRLKDVAVGAVHVFWFDMNHHSANLLSQIGL